MCVVPNQCIEIQSHHNQSHAQQSKAVRKPYMKLTTCQQLRVCGSHQRCLSSSSSKQVKRIGAKPRWTFRLRFGCSIFLVPVQIKAQPSMHLYTRKQQACPLRTFELVVQSLQYHQDGAIRDGNIHRIKLGRNLGEGACSEGCIQNISVSILG